MASRPGAALARRGGLCRRRHQRLHARLGPGHFGSLLTGPYPDGRRVIWSNGREQLAKLDAETLEVLATYAIPGVAQSDPDVLEADLAGLDELDGDEAILHDAPRSATIIATDTCRCIVVTKDALENVLMEHPAICLTLLHDAYRRLVTLTKKVGAGG